MTESAYLSTDNEALVAYFSSQGVPEEDIQFPPEMWHTDSPKVDLEETAISDACNSPLDVDSNPIAKNNFSAMFDINHIPHDSIYFLLHRSFQL